jgi:hypothetical protein
MRLRSWVAPCVGGLAFMCRSENADPAQTSAELGRVTRQRSEKLAPSPSTDATEPPSDDAP